MVNAGHGADRTERRYARRFALVGALDAEWQELVAASSPTVADWSQRYRILRGCGDLDAVLEAVRREPDAVLAALLTEAANGSRCAARTVLQSLLGKLVLMARRSRYAGIDDFVAALWCRIASYPVTRRPRRIAANLALDTLKDVTRAGSSVAVEDFMPWPPGEHLEAYLTQRIDRTAADRMTARTVIETAVGLRVIDRQLGEVLVSVYVDGLSSARAAERHATTPEVIRYRCSRATRQIRGQLSDFLDAA